MFYRQAYNLAIMKLKSMQSPFVPKRRDGDYISGFQDWGLVPKPDSPAWHEIEQREKNHKLSFGALALELASRLGEQEARALEVERLQRLGSQVVMVF